MELRAYAPDDYAVICAWVPDARAHAMWCANRLPYPLTREGFEAALEEHAEKYGDRAFVAVADEGRPIGFFCYSTAPETNVGMLKFVIVETERRGQGLGREMLALAVDRAFERGGADAVKLNVFFENDRARRCYARVGFEERTVVKDAFAFGEEMWGRCSMIVRKRM